MDPGTRCTAIWWLICKLIWVWEAEGGSCVLMKGRQDTGWCREPTKPSRANTVKVYHSTFLSDSWDQNIATYIKATKVWYNTVLWRMKTDPEVTLALFTSTLGSFRKVFTSTAWSFRKKLVQFVLMRSLFLKYYCRLCMCVLCTCADAHVSQHACAGQRISFWCWFSPSIFTRSLGNKLRSSGLWSKGFNAEPSHWFCLLAHKINRNLFQCDYYLRVWSEQSVRFVLHNFTCKKHWQDLPHSNLHRNYPNTGWAGGGSRL